MEFKELNLKGYQLRENEGDHQGALDVLNQALEVSETLDQKAEAKAQIGLTYWHMEDYDKAREVWLEALDLCEEAGEPGPLALAYRNMGRPEVTPEWEKQYEYMKKSSELAEKAGREDLVWFIHGVVAAAIEAGEMDIATEWSEKERVEMEKHLSGEIKVPNENNVHIWHTGYLMGAAFVKNDRSLLDEAMKIAEEAKLPKRIEHIEAAMAKFDGK